ncbi:SDR family oxidoreductase [Allorhizobium borbori]|uniref:NAD(P)-dependent dehydrogenase (Short-subunit alcohol dehydrogenase family) n=1 Tax=Allorhizobium borbori TaxID=485907 RepID=A0A7W6P0F1_9HYPH|nr:SDR family oxidoreductase [Allorhizobium borbori]MBB4102712.1 NAD(P)-dependent dehydrogenase (short-subunit alcohol dehydrogenase family) [Allorhizobium borbori]
MSGDRQAAALVTGGAKRIGKAIVEGLASQGFAVAIHANGSFDEAQELAGTLNRAGYRAAAVGADLQNLAETSSLIARATDLVGPIDLLVNNASTFRNDEATAFDAESFDAHFAVHVRAPSILAAAFAAALPEDRHGLIVNIIDQRVWALNPRFYSYTLSKAALWTATQTLAQALAPRIRVNAIGPGPTMKSDRQDPADFQAQVDGVILKRGPALAEFARTVRFLYDTPSITGQMIALDGGQHLAWETPDVAGISE